LRGWTDAGRVRAYRTPGGDRRYRQDDLAAFLRGQQQERAGKLADLIGPHGARLMPGASRRDIRRQPWYASVGPEAVETMRVTCRMLMDALAGYLSGGRGQRVAAQAGEEAGREPGRKCGVLRRGVTSWWWMMDPPTNRQHSRSITRASKSSAMTPIEAMASR